MLSDINLLPQKKRHGLIFVIIFSVIIASGIIGAAMLFLQYQSLSNEIAAKEQQLEKVIQLREAQENKLAEVSAKITSSEQFQSIVSVIQTLPIASIDVMDALSALLPQDGYFTSYIYSDSGTVELVTDFPSLEQVAGYLNRLYQENWVIEVELPSISNNERVTAPFNIVFQREAFRPKEGDDS